MDYKECNALNLFILLLLLFFTNACGKKCPEVDQYFNLATQVSLESDTLSIGDTVKVKMEFGRFLESPNYHSPIDMLDYNWQIWFVIARIDTVALEGYNLSYDNSVDFNLIQGVQRNNAILSKTLAPIYNDDLEQHIIEFDLSFAEPGNFMGKWGYTSESVTDDHLPQLECFQYVDFSYSVESGSTNHYLLDEMPESHIDKERFIKEKDEKGMFCVVVRE